MQELAWIDKGKQWAITNGPGYLVDLVVFVVILIVGAFVISALRRVTRTVLKKSGRVSEALEGFLINVLGKVLWVVLLMVALPRLGVDVAPLIAGLGVGGFIIGFAFQESLGNLAAGLMIMLNQPFRIGDFVQAGGSTGSIKEINMMATTMTTPDNAKVVVPNRAIWGGTITNYTALETRRVDLVLGISYNADIGKARDVVSSVLAANEMILKDPAPVVEVVEMADSSVNLVVRPWTNTENYWNVYFSINRGIKEALDQAGIEIPFPQMDLHHHGEPKTETT